MNPGDEVIIPTPIFPLYIPNVTIKGAKAVLVNDSQDDFKLTPEKLEATLKIIQRLKL
ncbi:MAG: Hypothetical protein AJITA_01114 [Acetilactobacillus jinshanensis]